MQPLKVAPASEVVHLRTEIGQKTVTIAWRMSLGEKLHIFNPSKGVRTLGEEIEHVQY